MQVRSVWLGFAVIVTLAGISRADFKYTQQSKVTGGTLVSVSKTVGVFSKNARQVTAPQLSTTMVHGNKLRTESPDGAIQIIDLDGKRFIHIDPAKKTYTIQTFEDMKRQIEQAREQVKEEQAKQAAKHQEAQNVTMVPKFDVQSTGQTRTIMNIPAKEMKMRVDMLFQSSDPKTQADLEKSNGSMWLTADTWYGSVPGYEEVRQFYMKMAKEMNWLPGAIGMNSPQMSEASEELKKNSLKVDGMPLVQYTSFGMAANGQSTQSGNGTSAQNQQPEKASDQSTPTNPRDAITKSFGGLFGKKKQKEEQNNNPDSSTGGAPKPASAPGSMMDVTTEMTSYSRDSLDSTLFEIPAGYTQVQPTQTGK